MAPIMALAFSEGCSRSLRSKWPPWRERRDACVQMIASCVIDLQHYWRDYPPGDDEGEPGADRPRPRKRGGRWLH